MGTKISLGRIYYPVLALGPGRRVGIWLNGCNRRCDGCISPELQMYDVTKEVAITDVMKMVSSIESPIEGFTISGGEPFYNPEALNELVLSLANISDDILIYSGYTIEELKARNDAFINSVLHTCSALIDGPYIKKLNNNIGLKGSSNQRCWIFKHFDKYKDIDSTERMLQTVVYGDKVLTIGIPQGDTAKW